MTTFILIILAIITTFLWNVIAFSTAMAWYNATLKQAFKELAGDGYLAFITTNLVLFTSVCFLFVAINNTYFHYSY